VGIISDGSGLLGVGRVKAQAMLPVLEAKAALLSAKAGLNGLPLALDLEKEDDLVDTVVRMSPSFGAVILDAIGSGRSLRVMQALSERLEIPVFDDDADGPAIAVLGALMNACTRIGRDLKEVKVGQVGLGAAGGSIARLVMQFTGNPVLGEDVHPAAMSRHVYQGGKQSSLEEIMRECDVVVANTGHADVIPASMVREGQAILALSMPNPEIDPYDATLAGAAFAADGQSIDKAVVFPGLLLGATAVRARTINDAMRVAAATKLAELAPDQDLLPSPLSETVHAQVAEAVADAAVRTGVADEVEASLRTAAVFTRVLNDEQQIPLARTCDGDS